VKTGIQFFSGFPIKSGMTLNFMEDTNYWKKCSTCKNEIGFDTPYQLCNVSTCRSKKTGLTFCSVACWDAHLGFANHRESYAEENRSPSKSAYMQSMQDNSNPSEPVRRKVVTATEPSTSNSPSSAPFSSPKSGSYDVDTLVVVSKLKKFIKDQTGFNTSQCCIDALTQKVAEECLKAAEHANSAERKTVMGRDVL
jgi:hypothetical protein